MVEVAFLFFPIMLGWFGEGICQGSTRGAKPIGDKYEEIYHKGLTYVLKRPDSVSLSISFAVSEYINLGNFVKKSFIWLMVLEAEKSKLSCMVRASCCFNSWWKAAGQVDTCRSSCLALQQSALLVTNPGP